MYLMKLEEGLNLAAGIDMESRKVHSREQNQIIYKEIIPTTEDSSVLTRPSREHDA